MMSKQTDQQQNEKPLSDEEQRLIGEVAGHLFDRCDEVRHTEKFQALAAEHDAVMRLRRLYDQQQKEIGTYAALCAQMAAALEAMIDHVADDEDEADDEWACVKKSRAAIAAYRTRLPDPQWQRVPEELEDLDELISINEAKASTCRSTCRPGNADEYEATVRALRNYATIINRARGEG